MERRGCPYLARERNGARVIRAVELGDLKCQLARANWPREHRNGRGTLMMNQNPEQPERPRYQTTDDVEARYAAQPPPAGPPPKPHRLRRGCLFTGLGALGLII